MSSDRLSVVLIIAGLFALLAGFVTGLAAFSTMWILCSLCFSDRVHHSFSDLADHPVSTINILIHDHRLLQSPVKTGVCDRSRHGVTGHHVQIGAGRRDRS